jgi:hypothetical protein
MKANYKEIKIEITFMLPDFLSITYVKDKVKTLIKNLDHFGECKKLSFMIYTKENEGNEKCQENWKPFS